ncbi:MULTISPECIES: hypothetical protein [unclassified Ruegeria]|uniref:hypothetical protein n=1 Tax=unclassified Ruegeria TaxID=2625375 RepID=UPI001491EE56|nr:MULTISPECIES: hypothetical protein [unclassified Ruegeria]NOD87426.1 hypothetical protein [Ruegeria sp. HKCCD4318]NOE12981.1 hypothetical protein [Ruegeria sp. HKCCD4318-2]NOG08852.1 hypothetical protein [Ruegeria sp. HKCCD4315]
MDFCTDIRAELTDALSPFEDAGVAVNVGVWESRSDPDLIVSIQIDGKFQVLDGYRVSLALSASDMIAAVMRECFADLVTLLRLLGANPPTVRPFEIASPRLTLVDNGTTNIRL